MIRINLNNIGKKFNREWIFRELTYTLEEGQKLVILGSNGSGKSTLLQTLAGFVTPNEGNLTYHLHKQVVKPDELNKHVALASPYLQLIEDYSLTELIDHVKGFKPMVQNHSASEVIQLLELHHAKDKLVKQFSSGMKQRLKLGLAILADTPLLLLDEPTSNLDKNAIQWYKQLIVTYTKNRTVIVCSNALEDEYFFCNQQLNVLDYKVTR